MPLQNNNKLIELCGISKRYDDGKLALRNVELTVNEGDFVAISGPNGGGKTTLLRIMLKLLKPTSGSVAYWSHGKAIKRLDVGYLPQMAMIDRHFPVTVADVVAMGLRQGFMKRLTAADNDAVKTTIEQVGLTPFASQPISTLSGGQLQRALLGRAIVSNPSAIALDEPLNYIDADFEAELYSLLRHLKGSHTVIIVSHDMRGIEPLATQRIHVDGTLTLA